MNWLFACQPCLLAQPDPSKVADGKATHDDRRLASVCLLVWQLTASACSLAEHSARVFSKPFDFDLMWIKQAETTNILDSRAERKYDANIPKSGWAVIRFTWFSYPLGKNVEAASFHTFGDYRLSSWHQLRNEEACRQSLEACGAFASFFLSYHFDLEKFKILTTHFTCTEVNTIGL